MTGIDILAYGSLINDLGAKNDPLIDCSLHSGWLFDPL